jgi:hypothetical protein
VYAWWGYDNSDYEILSQTFATTSGTEYVLSFYSRAASDVEGNVFRYQFGGGPILTVPRTTGYALTTDSFVADGPSTTLNFYAETDYGTGVWWLDDVSVVEASVPDPGSSLVLLGISLVGLRARRKRRQ